MAPTTLGQFGFQENQVSAFPSPILYFSAMTKIHSMLVAAAFGEETAAAAFAKEQQQRQHLLSHPQPTPFIVGLAVTDVVGRLPVGAALDAVAPQG
jgi:hypothetical protein